MTSSAPHCGQGSLLRTVNSADLVITTLEAAKTVNAAYLHSLQRVILPFAGRRFHTLEY
jgi:hypothetical protein